MAGPFSPVGHMRVGHTHVLATCISGWYPRMMQNDQNRPKTGPEAPDPDPGPTTPIKDRHLNPRNVT